MAQALPVIYGASAIIGAGAAAYGAYKMANQEEPEIPKPPEIPIESLPDDGREKRMRAGRQSTILTSPLASQNVLKPTLLGQ